jgi:hypothetical protein
MSATTIASYGRNGQKDVCLLVSTQVFRLKTEGRSARHKVVKARVNSLFPLCASDPFILFHEPSAFHLQSIHLSNYEDLPKERL